MPLYSPSPSKARITSTIKVSKQDSMGRDKDKVKSSSNSAFKPAAAYKATIKPDATQALNEAAASIQP
jgi:hypothetical protein